VIDPVTPHGGPPGMLFAMPVAETSGARCSMENAARRWKRGGSVGLWRMELAFSSRQSPARRGSDHPRGRSGFGERHDILRDGMPVADLDRGDANCTVRKYTVRNHAMAPASGFCRMTS